MRRLIALSICLAAASAGCVHGASPAPIASKACGGFHIVIENAAASEIAIGINGQPVTTAMPGETVSIAQIGNYVVPLMPWDVEARRVADGTVLLAIHLDDDGSDGRTVRVEDSPGSPATVRDYTC